MVKIPQPSAWAEIAREVLRVGTDAGSQRGAAGRWGGGGPEQSSECNAPHESLCLVPYALSACTEKDAFDFEAHMLACETCFQDLKCLDRAGRLIQSFILARDALTDRTSRRAELD